MQSSSCARLKPKAMTAASPSCAPTSHPKRALRPSRATVRFETDPGVQLQSDWGEISTTLAGQPTKIYFIVNQLGYSRRFHAWATPTALTLSTPTRGSSAASATSVAFPNRCWLTTRKPLSCTIPWADRSVQRTLSRSGDTLRLYSASLPSYRARTKGKDERMVGYLKQHFFVRYRAFDNWAHLNQLLEDWLTSEADQRCHGTLKEVVAEGALSA